ncbi:MAG: sulfatase-like hydrolase/transferase [Phaeodactylibacter sp.]|nr:sulfatase-like hydrolase/transferase [Phaeodactylibacter sp.]
MIRTLLALFLIGSWIFGAAQNDPERPNVILIYTDDQGTLDMGCYGAPDLYTPNMDALAASGVRFTQFYAGSSVCSPSRASLLTGMTPTKAGLNNNATSQPGSHEGLPAEAFTLAEALKAEGYQTAHIGKWHLGYEPDKMPNGQGFDYSFGHMGGCIDNYSHFFYWNGPNRHDLWRNGTEIWHDGEFFLDLMEREAYDYIRDHRSEPFFMYYAINMPHYPLQGKSQWRDYYADLPSPRKEYAAFISTIDESLGRLIDQLERYGLRENTIIILQSDHGHSTEVRTFGGGGYAGPYRGCKFSLFEAGIRVPAIISYPKAIPANEVRGQMVAGMDWFPTILDYAGADNVPEDLEGISLRGVIEDDAPSPHEYLIWEGPHRWAVRKGDWKLLYAPIDPAGNPDAAWEPVTENFFLVNLKDDVGESENVMDEHPIKVKELEKIYQKWSEGL